MSTSRYEVSAYDDLKDPRARRLYDWLVRYHQRNNGRRASHREMMAALDLSKEPLLDLLQTLSSVGLFEIEADAQGKARSYTLPGERWSHPHLTTLESRKAFYTGTLLDAAN